MSQFEKEIEVNGVKLTISKIDVFRQDELVQELLPVVVSTMSRIIAAPGNEKSAALSGIDVFLKELPAKRRSELIFHDLLPCAKLPNGMKLVGKVDGGPKTVMASELNSLGALYQVAFEVLRFNFEDFFDSVPSGLREKFALKMTR